MSEHIILEAFCPIADFIRRADCRKPVTVTIEVADHYDRARLLNTLRQQTDSWCFLDPSAKAVGADFCVDGINYTLKVRS